MSSREVKAFLAQRIAACEAAGIARERLVIDPGFGFGKSGQHNLALLRGLGALARARRCRCWRASRASPRWVRSPAAASEDRLAASLAAALLAVERGAAIVRVHDVAATRDALLVLRRGQRRQSVGLQ